MLHDIWYALRWLRRSPGFTAVAVLSLAVGIGFNTALFGILDAVLFRPLPVQAPDRLVDVFTSGADGDTYATTSYPDDLDVRDGNSVFDMLAYSPMFAAMSLPDRSRLVWPFAARGLGGVLYGISGADLLAWLGAGATILVVSIAANLIPAAAPPASHRRSPCARSRPPVPAYPQ